jgi:hypothetical protein
LGAGVTAPPPPAQPPDTVKVDVVAVHAFSENRGARVFDNDLKDLKDALSDLDYDTFRRLSATTLHARINEEATYEINSRYKLRVKPLSHEPSGQVRLSIRVEMRTRAPGAKPVDAVATTLLISPEKKLKVRGLKLDNGELVVVLMLRG